MSTPSSLQISAIETENPPSDGLLDRFTFPVSPDASDRDLVEMELSSECLAMIARCDVPALTEYLALHPVAPLRRDELGLTALMHMAASTGPVEKVIQGCDELVKRDSQLNSCDLDGFTVYHWAAACGHPEVLKHMLQLPGSDARCRARNGDSPLHRACRMGRVENVDVLLAFDPTLGHALNDSFETPLDVVGTIGSDDTKVRNAIRSLFSRYDLKTKTLILHHPDTLMHATRTSGSQGTFPWEAPERVTSIHDSLSKIVNGDPLMSVSSDYKPATDSDILRCHSREYLDLLESLEEILVNEDPGFDVRSCIPFTPAVQRRITRLPSSFMKSESLSDTSYSSGTLRAARAAAGSVIHGINQVFESGGRVNRVFCLVRPPGHHVGFGGPLMNKTCTSCGFSILNSVAIGAVYAVKEMGKRVAIIDIDIHHGNGTEDIVRHLGLSRDILFVSIHQADKEEPSRFYPGTGFEADYTYNIHNFPIPPMWANSTPSNRLNILETIRTKIVPLIASFRPDVILMSTGFDGACGDVGNCLHVPGKSSANGTDLSPHDFRAITRSIVGIANAVCQGRIVSVLEGGYGKMTWTTSTVVTKSSIAKRARKLDSTNSNDSTKASSDDWGGSDSHALSSSGSSPSTINRRNRINREIVHTQILNRQLLSQCAQQHVRALASL